ncbi:MAG: regulatory protein RecX [Gemmatimonadetes bacterium]|nr:regulatory protein RecX [Gemmatimonadota bacterium]
MTDIKRSVEPLDPKSREQVKERALGLLARREHSVKELGEKLRRRGDADEAVIRAVVGELAGKGLVSDARYAAAFASDAVRLRPRARQRVVSELVGKGVPARTAARAVDAALGEEGVDDASLARRLAEAYRPRLEGEPVATQWRRLAGHLQRRGFTNELVYSVCQDLLGEMDPEVG